MSFMVIVNAAAAPAYPLKKSANGRYLVDQNNTPVLMIGDAPHTLLVKLSDADASTYLINRSSNGFNTLWVELLAGNYVSGKLDASMLDGTKPFTNTLAGGQYDFTSPNEIYFAHVDNIVRMAATNGLQVLLDSIETGDWTSVALANESSRCRAYGQYLGNRYKNFTNIIWITGNDFQTWSIATNDAVVSSIALGILDMDTNHLQTVQLNYDISDSLQDPTWWPIINLNAVYTYYPTFVRTLLAYNRTNFLPTFLAEAHYEYETVGGTGTEAGTPNVLRRQEYFSLLSGALAGHMYGNHWTWTFESGWQAYLNSPGATQLKYFKDFFTSHAWYDLVPDQDHTVCVVGSGVCNEFGAVGDSDCATTARAANGSLVVVYLPALRTITIDMTKLAGTANAMWFDPSAGTYETISGSPFANTGTRTFTPTGNNSDGDGDWVLVLETTEPPETEPPTVTLTAPVGGATLSNTVPVTATATDNVGVAGVQFQVDGINLGAESLSPPFTNSWNTLTVPNGLHTVQAIARDSIGNRATNSVSVTVNNPVLPRTLGLVAAYAFNEGSGTTVEDLSGHGNTGVLGTATWTAQGKFGNALSFNGSSYVTVDGSDSLDLTGSMTLEAWVYPTAATGWSTAIFKEQNNDLAYGLFPSSGGGLPNVYIITSNGAQGVEGPSALPLNTWSHLAATYDAATLRLYVNGNQVASVSASGNIIATSDPLYIGGNAVFGEYFLGKIDEVRVYNRALSQGEIQNEMVSSPFYQITTASLPDGQVGASYSAQLAASDGTEPYSWNLAPGSGPMVDGLSLNTNGLLSGTPTLSGTFIFTVRVTDAATAVADQSLTLVVMRAASVGLLASSVNPAVPGSSVNFTYTLSGVPPGAGPPTGVAQFKVDGINTGSPVSLSGGVAVYTTAALTVGLHSVEAEYAGSLNFFGTTNSLAPAQLINTPPVAGPDMIERSPGSGTKVSIATLLANDTDADGDVPGFAGFSTNSAQGGSLSESNRWLMYVPPPGFTNVDSFTYTISDGRGAPVSGTVTINVQVDTTPSPNLEITSLGNGSYLIRFDGIPGKTYRIEYVETLEGPMWQTLASRTADDFGFFEYVDTPPNGSPMRYYRSVYP